MKILHLATRDIGGGGGGFDASYRLHRNMLAAGLDSRMMVLRKESDDDTVIDLSMQMSVEDKIRWFWSKKKNRLQHKLFHLSGYFAVDQQELFPAHRLLELLPFKPDVIVAHWISNFITALTLRDLSLITKAPLLWYLIDMAPLTGGCHYAFDCNRYTGQCGYCPQLGLRKGKQDLSHSQWQNKRDCVQEMNITAVTGSSWLQKQVESSSIFRGKRSENILLGLDVDIFCPIALGKARKLLDLPTDRKIIFFGTRSTDGERKGFRYFLGALKRLHAMLEDNRPLRNHLLIVTAGRGKNVGKLDTVFEHRHIGLLTDDVILAAAYQGADVFVNASVEDSGPMMINEAILCGTPVVSFEMGVAVDLVHTDLTGYRARLRDERDMAAGLRRILEADDEDIRVMRQNCRSYGVKKCHPNVQVRAFESLCAELVAGDKC